MLGGLAAALFLKWGSQTPMLRWFSAGAFAAASLSYFLEGAMPSGGACEKCAFLFIGLGVFALFLRGLSTIGEISPRG